MSKTEHFMTSSKDQSITQNVSTVELKNLQETSLTSDWIMPHSTPVKLQYVTAKTQPSPNQGELGDILPIGETLALPPKLETRDLFPHQE